MRTGRYGKNGCLCHFDPRTKILLLTICVIAASIAPSLKYEGILVLAIAIFGCISGEIRCSLFYMVFYAGFYLLTLYILSLKSGILYTVFAAWMGLFYKVYPCAFLAGILITTTRVNEFLTAMNKAHISDKVVIPLAVMLRYIPTVREDWRFIKDAMRLRDVSPSFWGFLTNPFRTIECIYVPLMMTASNTADELSVAAVTRGIENPIPRTCLLQICFQIKDWVAVIAAVGLLVLGMIWERI